MNNVILNWEENPKGGYGSGQPLKTADLGDGWKIELWQDEDPQNPIEFHDIAWTWCSWHRDRTLGAKKEDQYATQTACLEWLAGTAKFARSIEGYLEDHFEQYHNQPKVDKEEYAKACAYAEKYGNKLPELSSCLTYKWSYEGWLQHVAESEYLIMGIRCRDNWMPTCYLRTLDEGCDGLTYISKKDAIKEWGKKGGKILTAKVKQKAIDYITIMAKEISSWMEGDVYGLAIVSPDGERHDSCWGFIGHEYAEGGAAQDILYGLDDDKAKWLEENGYRCQSCRSLYWLEEPSVEVKDGPFTVEATICQPCRDSGLQNNLAKWQLRQPDSMRVGQVAMQMEGVPS